MHNLLAVYDLTNYAPFRALGIVLSLAAAGVILIVTLVIYRKSLAKENAQAEMLESNTYVSPPVTASPPIEEEPVTASPPIEEEPVAEVQEEIEEEPVAAEEPIAEVQEEPEAEPIAAEVAAVTAVEMPEEQAEPDIVPDFIYALAASMPKVDKEAFEDIVIKNSKGIKSSLLPLSKFEEERIFLRDFFKCTNKYKKELPLSTIEILFEKARDCAKGKAAVSRINGKMAEVYYFNRKNKEAYVKCEALCLEDIELNLSTRKVKNVKVPTVKRLLLIYSSRRRFKGAIELCDRAIAHGLVYRKGEGYEEYRKALVTRYEKQRARSAKQRQKKSEQKSETIGSIGGNQ